MGRYNKDTKPLKPSGFGIVVDQSKVKETIQLRGNCTWRDTILNNKSDRVVDDYEPFDRFDKIFFLIVILVWIVVGFFMTVT